MERWEKAVLKLNRNCSAHHFHRTTIVLEIEPGIPATCDKRSTFDHLDEDAAPPPGELLTPFALHYLDSDRPKKGGRASRSSHTIQEYSEPTVALVH